MSLDLTRIIISSIKNCILTDENFGIAFSGGIDSSLLAKISSDIYKENVILLSIGFPFSHDLEFSRRIAKELNMKHFTHEIKNEEFKKFSTKTVFSLFAYGFYPVMTSRVSYNGITVNSMDKNIKNFSLADRKNYRFKMSQDYLSNTVIFNSKKHCLLFDIREIIKNNINGFLIDSRFLEEEEIYHIFKLFIEGLVAAKNTDKPKKDEFKSDRHFAQKYETFLLKLSKSPYVSDYTKGHLYREVM